jgi:agmatinase
MVALDVVEVSPPYDVSENTVNNAHRVVFESLAGMAWRRREAAGGTAGPPAMPH